MSFDALRIQNLRCIPDTPRIPIRPITVLIGRNSSGKSTFLRAFPLLRQSVETATESPILWYHPRYVDFGTIKDAIYDRAAERSVTFEFTVTLSPKTEITLGIPEFRIALTVAEGAASQGAYVKGYDISCEGWTAELRFSPMGHILEFRINGEDLTRQLSEMSLGGAAYLLPTLKQGDHLKVTYKPVDQPLALDPPRFRVPHRDGEPWLDLLREVLRPLLHGLTSDDTLISIADELKLGTPSAMREQLKNELGNRKAKWDQLRSSDEIDEIMLVTFARMLPWILDAADQEVADFASRIAYLKPLRAMAERSYRTQDLSVGDVSPDGNNLAMFIRSLSQDELQSFASFTREHLGFETKIGGDSINAEILVKEPRGDRFINLVDIGFGYTEVLPFMAILWSTCCRGPREGGRPTSLLAVEQPELHLHPAHQVKLAKVLAGAWRASLDAGREVKLMIETHSEGIVNGLGELIQKGSLRASDVQLVLFDQDRETRQTTVKLAGYTEEGALNDDWPFGFFAPVEDD